MDQLNSTTHHQKGKHLSFEERVIIQTRLKDNLSPNKIAAELGCSPNTVRNEIKRGTVSLYSGNVQRYKATVGQSVYEANRGNSCRRCEYLSKLDFITYVENRFFNDDISIDACVGEALANDYFPRKEMLCTKTVYNYIDKGLMMIRNHHLPEKISLYFVNPNSSKKQLNFLFLAKEFPHFKQIPYVKYFNLLVNIFFLSSNTNCFLTY